VKAWTVLKWWMQSSVIKPPNLIDYVSEQLPAPTFKVEKQVIRRKLSSGLTLPPCTSRQTDPPKRWCLSSKLHGVTLWEPHTSLDPMKSVAGECEYSNETLVPQNADNVLSATLLRAIQETRHWCLYITPMMRIMQARNTINIFRSATETWDLWPIKWQKAGSSLRLCSTHVFHSPILATKQRRYINHFSLPSLPRHWPWNRTILPGIAVMWDITIQNKHLVPLLGRGQYLWAANRNPQQFFQLHRTPSISHPTGREITSAVQTVSLNKLRSLHPKCAVRTERTSCC